MESSHNIFLDMTNFGKESSFMQKRTLLEFVMIKKILEGQSRLPLSTVLDEAGLNYSDNPPLGYLLQAVAQNKVVFIAHQDLYRSMNIAQTKHLEVMLECDPWYIRKWAKNAGSSDVFSFEHVSDDIRKNMIGELVENINFMKQTINDSKP